MREAMSNILKIAFLSLTMTSNTPASEARLELDLPAQAMATALRQLAAQAHLQILFDAPTLQGHNSRALKGRYTVTEALAKLLAGSGLSYSFTGSNAVAITGHASGDATALPKVTVKGKTLDDEPSPDDPRYSRKNTTTATKTDTPILSTPFAIQVVPQAVIKDQQAFRLSKAIENISGVFDASSTGANVLMVRGFRTTDYYRDGARIVSGASIGGQREMANMDRIEVLKGPASILYGRAEPGGMVNLAPKQPVATPYYALNQQFGSYDFYRSTLDMGGPVPGEGNLLYRFNLAYENAASFREFVENERIFLSPVLRWNLSEQTQVDFFLEYKHSHDPMDTGTVAVGNRPARVPTSRNFGEPFASGSSDDVLVGFNWSHAFNENWKLRNRFQTQQNSFDLAVVVGSGFNPADPSVLERFASPQSGSTETYFTSLDLTGKFDTFGVEHTLLLGGDYSQFSQDALYRFTASFPSINIYHPIHTGGSPVIDPSQDFDLANTDDWYGLFVQDQMKLPYGLKLLAGMRYDNAWQTNDLTDTKDSDQDRVTPRVGLVWEALPQLSLYGNYVQNFGGVNSATFLGGSRLPPQSAQQWEIGLKTEVLEGRLRGSLAFYELTKQNISTPNPQDVRFYLATGEARSRGMELDVSGEILPGWNVIGSYAYTDARITQDAEDAQGQPIGDQGKRLYNVPRNAGSLWTTYEFAEGDWRGLKGGMGIVARSQREGDNANSFQLPGYVTLNMMAGYGIRIGPSLLSLQLNIENLLDRRYFPGADGSFSFVNVGAPRTFLGSVRLEF